MKVRASIIRAGIIAMIIVAAIGAYLVYSFNQPGEAPEEEAVTPSGPVKIASLEELKELISRGGAMPFPTMPRAAFEAIMGAPAEVPAKAPVGEAFYSTTNVQVEGIDEADIIKTDGEFIYYSRGKEVLIVNASSLEVISSVESRGFVNGLYLYGDILVTIEGGIRPVKSVMPWSSTEVMVSAYNISDVNSPELVYSAKVSGNYLSSRLYNGYLYVVTSEPAYIIKGVPVRPLLDEVPVPPERITYLGGDARSYTTLLVIDLETFEDSVEVLLASSASRIYMSYDSLYITSHEYYMPFNRLFKEVMDVYLGFLPDDLGELASNVLDSSLSEWTKASIVQGILSDYFSKLSEDERANIAKQIRPQLEDLLKGKTIEKTSVFRFALNGISVALVANASVPGRVLEQFAMDERDGTFRIATTSTRIKAVQVEEGNPAYFWPETEPSTGLYILDKEDLELIGKVEGLAPGERMYAARYVGSAAFLVTFRRVDPLFAIDISDPANPKVVGYTKIPGYSEYLHPYGNYLVGIGPDADEQGRVKGLKISLFDVTNLGEVKEVDALRVDSPFANSEVFYDYHAFLAGDGWFAIPVNEVKDYLWIISVQDGRLVEEAQLEHKGIRRGLYIGDIVYTVSDAGIEAYRWGTWEEVGSLWFERPPGKLYIGTAGFSYRIANDTLRIDVVLELPNPCYALEPGKAIIEDGRITLYALVQEPPKGQPCIQVIATREVSYMLEKPSEGSYDVTLILNIEPSGGTVSLYLGAVEVKG